MKQGSFFIVGAPKCGTTALYEYLRTHPNAFLPRLKEPHYYATDLPRAQRAVVSSSEYQKLFRPVTDQHMVAGEASVFYLLSQTAVPNILKEHPDARFIVMLRDPIDLVQSLHSEYFVQFWESEPSFEVAWRLQGQRQRGEQVPKHCPAPQSLVYGPVGMLGQQVERLLSVVRKSQVLFLKMDDLHRSPRMTYLRVLNFLGLPDDGKVDFPRMNVRRRHRIPWLSEAFLFPPKPIRWMGQAIRQSLGIENTGLIDYIHQLLQAPADKVVLTAEFRRELQAHYAQDQLRLEAVLSDTEGSTSFRAKAA